MGNYALAGHCADGTFYTYHLRFFDGFNPFSSRRWAVGFVTFVKSNAKALLTAKPTKVLRSPREYDFLRILSAFCIACIHLILSHPIRDGCDDCDGIFDNALAPILIVTTVINRHTVFLAKLIELPFLVRFMVYSMPCSFSNSPALILSLRVRILG